MVTWLAVVLASGPCSIGAWRRNCTASGWVGSWCPASTVVTRFSVVLPSEPCSIGACTARGWGGSLRK
uniref:Putative secreted protein n=1 Tax=Ixodes ricinus TaxID=34613 RepID=A0A6B0TQX6_IXORI